MPPIIPTSLSVLFFNRSNYKSMKRQTKERQYVASPGGNDAAPRPNLKYGMKTTKKEKE
jgi:hypothetical protein